MPRYSINLTDEEVAAAKAWAAQEDRTLASLFRCIFKAALHVGNLASIQRQNDVTSASLPRQNSVTLASDPQCPSLPPRAPASDSGEEVSEEVLPPKPPAKSAAKKRAPAAALVDQEIASDIVAHLNAKAGTNYRPTGQSARQLISARLGEGYTVEDIKAVIEKKAAEWRGDPKMEKFLRPGTLFGREKFEQYHGQKAGAQAALDLGTEAGKRASWERAGVKQTYKPRPTPEEWLAAKEKDDA